MIQSHQLEGCDAVVMGPAMFTEACRVQATCRQVQFPESHMNEDCISFHLLSVVQAVAPVSPAGGAGVLPALSDRATGQETLAVGWALAAVLVLKTLAAAERSPRTPHRRAEVFADLSVQELKAVHDFLWSRKELNLESSPALTMAKNCFPRWEAVAQ
ncbi:Amiloride-sensitive amine oxidase [copper-containing] [Manis javanica]|nr:Amiloride-sensitive amine oxidase [copper-containing] [Manis javanica]